MTAKWEKQHVVNLYLSDGTCYVWVALEESGEDLDLCMIGNDPPMMKDREGEPTGHWLEFELNQAGWECIISPEHTTVDSSQGWCFGQTWVNFALREGLAPRQAFLLKLDPPVYSQSYDYWSGGYEYDVEYSWEIIAREPYSQKKALRAWDKWINHWQNYTQAAEKAMAELKQKQVTDFAAMYIHWDGYWTGPYDEMTPPNGVICNLCTRHTDVTGISIPGGR